MSALVLVLVAGGFVALVALPLYQRNARRQQERREQAYRLRIKRELRDKP